MPPEAAGRGPATAIARMTARRAGRSGALWGIVFGASVATTASGYATSFHTAASRATLARSIGTNAGLAALLGPARRLDTVAGFTAWRTMGVLTLIGAIWGLFAATRWLRGEEDAGRWELFLAGQTTRGRAVAQAMVGLGVGFGALWAVTAVLTIADATRADVAFPVSASVFLATALVAGAALFLAVGVVTSELAGSRRQANLMGGAVLGAAYLVRMAADADRGLAWLRWASPLGWIEQLRPLTGSRPAAGGPIVLVIVVALGAGAGLAGRRDLGTGALASGDRPARFALAPRGVGRLTIRLCGLTVAGWIIGLAICGLVFGLVAQSAANALSGSETIERALGRLGGHAGGAASYLGITFLVVTTLVAFAAAGQVAASRAEEAEGWVDNLVVRPVSRTRWLVGRLSIATALVLGAGVVAGLAAWVGASSQHSGIGLRALAEAGLNTTPPALFVLGTGTLLYGVWPRLAVRWAYAAVTWSVLVEFIASIVTTNRWVLDSSLFHHIAPAPAAPPAWDTAAAVAGLGALAAVIGVAAFAQRDLLGA